MRSRSALVLPVLALAVALIGPAEAHAGTVAAGNFVNDNVKYLVAALVAAVLLLLLVVSVTQRRSKEKT
jgi:fumarate reductase subunit D